MASGASIRRSRPPRGVTGMLMLSVLTAIAFASYLFVERHQALPTDTPEQAQAKIAAAKKFTGSQMTAMLEAYKKDTGRYPTTVEGVWALFECPPRITGWQGPYYKKQTMPIDPWGQVYHYAFPGPHNGADHFDAWSTGPDGLDGTADDIGNW